MRSRKMRSYYNKARGVLLKAKGEYKGNRFDGSYKMEVTPI